MTTTTVTAPTTAEATERALALAADWLRGALDRLDPAGELFRTAERALHDCTAAPAVQQPPAPYRPGPPSSLLRADRARLEEACRAAEAADRLPAEVRAELAGTLPAVLVAALRCYDLVFGPELLRAVVALRGRDDPTVLRAVDFLLAQQQPDGSFGAFGGEIEALAQGSASAEEPVPVEEVLVPVTAACVRGLRAVGQG
ncbi:hypothetical protein [Streptomyces sp. NPDC048442]|uniref:hypothetical protein n=1 Tax=Streptomyces sp. NPDC048442 TaxID=3154823 RepID=UPI0034256D4D